MDRETIERGELCLPEPLSHANLDGHIYQRQAIVEQQITAALILGPQELEARCQLRDGNSPNFLKEESLVYLIRHYYGSGNSVCVSFLSESLLSRCATFINRYLRSLEEDSTEEGYDAVVEQLFTRILDLENDRGDFLQVRFWLALKRLTVQVYRKQLKQVKREQEDLPLTSLAGYDTEDSDELSPNMVVPTPDSAMVRSAESEFIENHVIQAALQQLEEPVRTAYLLRHYEGWPIEDQDPAVRTISNHFEKTPRTIRNWLAKADDRLAAWRGEWR